MKRHVIILAQGPTPGRMFHRLPCCGGVSILGRTLLMARTLDDAARITVVARDKTLLELAAHNAGASSRAQRLFALRIANGVAVCDDPELEEHELADPGTSALKGISRYLDHRRDLENLAALDFRPSRTIVLAADVVYSWACLSEMFDSPLSYSFVGSSDLDDSRGEFFGVTWRRDVDALLIDWLKKANRKHGASSDVHQRAQFRQWFFAARSALHGHGTVHYVTVSDYTRDFDTDDDTAHLLATSGRAQYDDRNYGFVWE